MLRIFAILLSFVVAAPAAAQTLNYTIELEDNGSPWATGSGQFDVNQLTDPRADLYGFSDLQGPPPNQFTWVVELLLANEMWRWFSLAGTPPDQFPTQVDGNLDVNFGAAGFMDVTYTIDVQALTGHIKVEVFNWVPGVIYDPLEPFWADVHQEFDGSTGGTENIDGCVIVNGKQIATILGDHDVTPIQNFSQLPTVQVRASARCTNYGDDLEFQGDLFLQEDQSVFLQVFFDIGQGFVSAGNGTFSVIGDPDPRHEQFNGFMDFSDQSFDPYLFLVDFGWINSWLRLYRPRVPWSGTQPGGVTGSQVLDFGASGQIDVTLFYFGSGSLQIGFDLTQFVPGFTNPPGSYEIHVAETFTGQPGGVLTSVGTIYGDGIMLGTMTGSYTGTAGFDAETQPITMVDVWTDNLVDVVFPSISYSGRGRQDESATASFTTAIDTPAGPVSGTGSFTITPEHLDDPQTSNDPVKFSVTGQIDLDTPLPERELLLGELPAIAGWMRKKASLSLYPSLGSSYCDGEMAIWYLPGLAASTVTIDSENDTIDTDTNDSHVDLSTLSLLPLKFWVEVLTTTTEDDGEATVEDDDCVTVCEDQNGEVVCMTECAVRARMKREIYDKDGSDFFLPLLSRLLLCAQFSQDEETITFTGEFVLEEYTGSVGVPAQTSLAMSPPRPNPTPGLTTFAFQLPAQTEVGLDLYDARGRRVRTLRVGLLPAGSHVLRWDGVDDRGESVASGVYWARLRAGSELSVQRVVVLR